MMAAVISSGVPILPTSSCAITLCSPREGLSEAKKDLMIHRFGSLVFPYHVSVPRFLVDNFTLIHR
jgi:hypothetical protein